MLKPDTNALYDEFESLSNIKIGIANLLGDHLTVGSFNKSLETMPGVQLEVIQKMTKAHLHQYY